MPEKNLLNRTFNAFLHAHYGWYIVAIGAAMQLTTNFVSQAFAVLVVVIRDNFGWSLTAIVLAYSLRSVIGAVLAPSAGVLGDRYGARKVMFIGGGFFVGGLLASRFLSVQSGESRSAKPASSANHAGVRRRDHYEHLG